MYHCTMSERLEKLKKLLAMDPKDTFVLYAMAQECFKQGDYAGAVDYYQRCIEADASYCYAYYHMAVAQKHAGQLDQARATIQAGIQAAHRAKDHKALGELSTLQVDLAEAR